MEFWGLAETEHEGIVLPTFLVGRTWICDVRSVCADPDLFVYRRKIVESIEFVEGFGDE